MQAVRDTANPNEESTIDKLLGLKIVAFSISLGYQGFI